MKLTNGLARATQGMENTAPQRREYSKLIRFTSSELEIVNDRARACSRPVACYIREVSLGGRPKATATLNSAVIRELARIATRLRDLQRCAVDRALPEAAEFGLAVGELVDLIRRID